MGDMENKEIITRCNYAELGAAYMTLTEIAEILITAYEKAAGMASEFSECYEGEAVEEVLTFLNSLPQHLYKMSLFYGKMAQFVIMSLSSFAANDSTMSDTMEN